MFMTSLTKYIDFRNNLKRTNNKGFLCKCTSKNIKINSYSANSYRFAIKLFNGNKLEYHTYQSHEEKSYKFVIGNLHHIISTDKKVGIDYLWGGVIFNYF